MNLYGYLSPKYWKCLQDKEIRADIHNLINKGKSKETIINYLDNLNFF